jgi:guanine deaminase
MNDQDDYFMHQALALAQRGIELGDGGPFGAVVVVDGRIVGQAWNQVVRLNDPTAHAEMLAIRSACEATGSFHLSNASLYTTCEPCPMCLGAAYWARVDNLIYGATAEDADAIGFNDLWMKAELKKPLEKQIIHVNQRMHDKCTQVLRQWWNSENRLDY